MTVSKLLGRLLGSDSGGVELRKYECAECGNTFDSAKQPERAQCMDCLSNDVDVIGTVDRS